MPLKNITSQSNQALGAVRKPAADKFSFSKALLGEDLKGLNNNTQNPAINTCDQSTDMDHYFARKKFESDMDVNEESMDNGDSWNDNQSAGSSNHTFIIDETQSNNSGLWAGHFDMEDDWLDNGESSDLNKSLSYEDYPSSRDRSFERPPCGSYEGTPSGDNSGRLPKRRYPQEEYFERVSSRRRPEGLDLMRSYQPTPSKSEPRLSKSFNESMMPTYDQDSDDQSKEDTRKRRAYRKKVETHYKKLVENKVMTPESEILNQSWSSWDARTAGIDGTDSPSYKIGVDESDWKEIDHHRTMSMERDRSNSSLEMHPDETDRSNSRVNRDNNDGKERKSEERAMAESSESSPEHHKGKEKVKKRVRVRRHDSLIKYGSEPDLSSRSRTNPIVDVSQSQESLQNYSFNDQNRDANAYGERGSYVEDYNSETGEISYKESPGEFYKNQADYYKTLPRGGSPHRSPKQNLSRPRSTPKFDDFKEASNES